jgi:hypothetical protein
MVDQQSYTNVGRGCWVHFRGVMTVRLRLHHNIVKSRVRRVLIGQCRSMPELDAAINVYCNRHKALTRTTLLTLVE